MMKENGGTIDVPEQGEEPMEDWAGDELISCHSVGALELAIIFIH
jgi:hypothetical protein